MFPLLFALQLAVTPVPVGVDAPPVSLEAPRPTVVAPQVTAEVPWTALGPFGGLIFLGFMAIKLGERALDQRAAKKNGKRSDPPPAMPGGLPTAACELFHKSIIDLGPKVEILTGAVKESCDASKAAATASTEVAGELREFIAYQRGAASTGTHRAVGR